MLGPETIGSSQEGDSTKKGIDTEGIMDAYARAAQELQAGSQPSETEARALKKTQEREARELKEKEVEAMKVVSTKIKDAGYAIEQIDDDNIRVVIGEASLVINAHKNLDDWTGPVEYTVKVTVDGKEKVIRSDYSVHEVMNVIDLAEKKSPEIVGYGNR